MIKAFLNAILLSLQDEVWLTSLNICHRDMDCQWNIAASSNGFRIMVDVREYIIEDGEGADCVYDSLRFYDG